MKAYKCDRCGKFFEKYENQGTSNFLNITRNPCMSGNCLDLCQNCNAELQEWVMNCKEFVDVGAKMVEPEERENTYNDLVGTGELFPGEFEEAKEDE